MLRPLTYKVPLVRFSSNLSLFEATTSADLGATSNADSSVAPVVELSYRIGSHKSGLGDYHKLQIQKLVCEQSKFSGNVWMMNHHLHGACYFSG